TAGAAAKGGDGDSPRPSHGAVRGKDDQSKKSRIYPRPRGGLSGSAGQFHPGRRWAVEGRAAETGGRQVQYPFYAFSEPAYYARHLPDRGYLYHAQSERDLGDGGQ